MIGMINKCFNTHCCNTRLKASQIRISLGMTQICLAKKAGVSRSTIRRIESGCINYASPAVIKVANALGVKNPYLLLTLSDPEFLAANPPPPKRRPKPPKPFPQTPPSDFFDAKISDKKIRRSGSSIIKMSDIRREKGLTQKDLAELCNLHFSSIQLIESGRLRPSADTLQRIAAVLGADNVNDLMDESAIKSISPPDHPSADDLALSKTVRGVHWSKHARRWTACVYTKKIPHHLGYFDNVNDAISAVEKFRKGDESYEITG